MELKLGDVQTTALIPLAVKANETMRKNARIKDRKAVEIIKALNIDTAQYDKFMSHEGVIARTIMLDRQLKGIIKKAPDTVIVNVGAGFDDRFSRMDNGRMGNKTASLEQVISAAKAANIHETIASLPNGYQTVVSDSTGLSGGEKQRIAIARAILKDVLFHAFMIPLFRCTLQMKAAYHLHCAVCEKVPHTFHLLVQIKFIPVQKNNLNTKTRSTTDFIAILRFFGS